VTRIDDVGMAEMFMSEEHVGFLRSCLHHVDPEWVKSRVGKETKQILDEADQAFLAKKLEQEELVQEDELFNKLSARLVTDQGENRVALFRSIKAFPSMEESVAACALVVAVRCFHDKMTAPHAKKLFDEAWKTLVAGKAEVDAEKKT
jgi:hypothetical protein